MQRKPSPCRPLGESRGQRQSAGWLPAGDERAEGADQRSGGTSHVRLVSRSSLVRRGGEPCGCLPPTPALHTSPQRVGSAQAGCKQRAVRLLFARSSLGLWGFSASLTPP